MIFWFNCFDFPWKLAFSFFLALLFICCKLVKVKCSFKMSYLVNNNVNVNVDVDVR